MDGDTVTATEDLMRESAEEEVSDDGVAMDNLTTLMTDAWESVRAPGVRLHELAVLVLSAGVVAAHGLLGVVPRALPRVLIALTPPGHLLHVVLALVCICSIAAICIALHQCLSADFDDEVKPGEEDVAESAPPACNVDPDARQEKEERVQRWINNLYSGREQVSLEAGGEVTVGQADVHRDASCTDLLGDGQAPPEPSPAIPETRLVPASIAATKEGRKALSLAQELSVAVRQRTRNEVRASMSAPVTPSLLAPDLLPLLTARRQPEPLPAPVRRQPESLPAPVRRQPESLPAPVRRQPESLPAPARRRQEFLPAPATPSRDDWRLVSVSQTHPGKSQMPDELTPEPVDGARTPTYTGPDTTLASSSLINFVRRFSGARFLVGESFSLALPSTTAEAATSTSPPEPADRKHLLRTKDSTSVMKVFSKGILSDGGIDLSTTSIQTDGNRRAEAADSGPCSGAGALSLSAQEAAGLLPAKATCAVATSIDSETFFNCEPLARSALNLATPLGQRSRSTLDPFEDTPWMSGMPTVTRSLTANSSDEGPPKRAVDADSDHKSWFDVRKSLLSSIPEAIPPDEDSGHL